MACDFCYHKWPGDLVFEDDTVWVVLHEDWSARGHVVIIPKPHVLNLSDLNPREAMRYSAAYRRAEIILLRETGMERAIMLKLGIITPHLHLHIFPVSSKLDRAAVMAIIEGKTHEPRDEEFVKQIREAMDQFREM
jgi:diadenosine tetraphosphate (Ap4A) HIT family hydrolase